jgi:Fe-Mn family superoxide dismutase
VGAGWVWLVLDDLNMLQIYSTINQDTPLQFGLRPILGIDMWEHAYILDYFNNGKKTYVKNLLTILDWSVIEQSYENYLKN